jgi:hypothetical protein
MQPTPNIETFGEIVDTAGENRLLLRSVERLLNDLVLGGDDDCGEARRPLIARPMR